MFGCGPEYMHMRLKFVCVYKCMVSTKCTKVNFSTNICPMATIEVSVYIFTLNMKSYRQLPTVMHLISKPDFRVANDMICFQHACTLSFGLQIFKKTSQLTDISPVCSCSQSLYIELYLFVVCFLVFFLSLFPLLSTYSMNK